MAFCGNYLLSCVNSLLLFLSIPFLLAGVIVKSLSDSPCNPIIYKPLIMVGVILLFLSLLGILGACCRIKVFLWIYLSLLLVLIFFLAFILIFGASNIKGDDGTNVEGTQLKEYRLQDFSFWLRDKMVNDRSWAEIRTCMQNHQACEKIQVVRGVVDIINLQRSKASDIEVGCCMPPPSCGFEAANYTWEAPKGGFKSKDPDCKLWSNNSESLCYNCSQCKAGYLAQFLKYWRKLTVVNIVLVSILAILFLVGCCALL